MEEIRRAIPDIDPSQISSEALELAIEHLQGALPSESQPTDDAEETFSLDAAMAYAAESYAARVAAARAAAGQPLLPFLLPAWQREPAGTGPVSPAGHLPAAHPAPDRGLSPATLQTEPPSATEQTAFTKDISQEREASVSSVASGTGRTMQPVGEEPGPRLSGRSESPRQSGPQIQDGDHAMEGAQTTASLDIPLRQSFGGHVASGEKAKARDIINAIRTLKTIEQEQRPATADERQALARFGGFGPVALSIFPDPVTGRYKDAVVAGHRRGAAHAAYPRGV